MARSSESGSSLTIHLVRHGETDWNRERRLQGWTDVPLNAAGLAQAQDAASALAVYEIGAVLSSDLTRARQTAEAIAARVGLVVSTDVALRERNYGAAEGQLDDDLDRQFDGKLDRCWADPDLAFEGGETRRQLYRRLERYVAVLLARPPGHEIVIVSHGGALRALRGVLEHITVEDLPEWDPLNGEVTTLVVDVTADSP